MAVENRRPIKARSLSVIQRFAGWLAKTSVTPNQISVLSVLFSLLYPLRSRLLNLDRGWHRLLLCWEYSSA